MLKAQIIHEREPAMHYTFIHSFIQTEEIQYGGEASAVCREQKRVVLTNRYDRVRLGAIFGRYDVLSL